MSQLVDTHCHIHSLDLGGERFTHDLWAKDKSLNLKSVINEAAASGVTRLITVGCNLEDSQMADACAKANPSVWASIGIHPHEAKDYANNKPKLKEFTSLKDSPKVVAIGECGLDYFYTHSSKSDQRTLLEFQLELATEQNLPLIFHVREAFDDFWPIFDSFASAKLKGVLHSYTDSTSNLEQALKRGLYIGVNGIATFTKDPIQSAMIKQIPLTSLVLETDSPYLSPQPVRGTINQPKNVKLVAQYLSNLRGDDLNQLCASTSENASQLFAIN